MDDKVRPVWVDPSWLSWQAYDEGSRYLEGDTVTRSYEIHQHACDILAGDPNRDQRGDVIRALRRVVGRRVKELKEIYQLRDLPTCTKAVKDLELLESFGIIRPFMLKRLIEIRNFVEHEDSIPPPADECLMFADLAWYFLRSTDKLVQLRLDRISFVPPGEDFFSRDYHPALAINFPNLFSEPPVIEAWLNLSSTTYEPRADWMKIESTEIAEHKEYEPTQLIFKGKVSGTDEQMKRIYELYFRISHFG